jgi:hypothetical protein
VDRAFSYLRKTKWSTGVFPDHLAFYIESLCFHGFLEGLLQKKGEYVNSKVDIKGQELAYTGNGIAAREVS